MEVFHEKQQIIRCLMKLGNEIEAITNPDMLGRDQAEALALTENEEDIEEEVVQTMVFVAGIQMLKYIDSFCMFGRGLQTNAHGSVFLLNLFF